MLESIYLTRSRVRAQLLGLLFSNLEKKYYLSELARLVSASAGNAQRELERFVRDELLVCEKKGNLTYYVVNRRHALFPELQSLVLKTVGIEGEIRLLVNESHEIKLALLFGSFASGKEKGESDVDLLIVSDGTLEKFYSAISKLESRFNRDINPVVYSTEEIKKRIHSRDSFVMHVLKQPYRILKGDLCELKENVVPQS